MSHGPAMERYAMDFILGPDMRFVWAAVGVGGRPGSDTAGGARSIEAGGDVQIAGHPAFGAWSICISALVPVYLRRAGHGISNGRYTAPLLVWQFLR